MNTATQVGVIGTGKMGEPMARHLLKTAQQVWVFDQNPEPLKRLAAEGCQVALHPNELVDHCQLVLLVVSFDHQVLDLLTGPEGLFSQAKKPITVMISSTVEPATMAQLAAQAPPHISLVDAPICRGEQAAEAADLLAMVGGEASVVAAVEPHLRAFCTDVDHLGELGAGQVGKALNNFILWSCICVNHEAFTLGKQFGLDQETLRQSLLKSSGENWAMKTWNRKRTMPWAEKDMRIILNMADAQHLPLPMAGFIEEHIKWVKSEWGLLPKEVSSDKQD